MTSEIKENYVLLSDEHDDICGFASFLSTIFNQFSAQNLILDLLKYDQAQLSDLLCYLELSNNHRASKHSFVMINAALSIDEIPEELMVVPTLQEAVDVVQMEEIEREMGF
jgi:hypothetical protein